VKKKPAVLVQTKRFFKKGKKLVATASHAARFSRRPRRRALHHSAQGLKDGHLSLYTATSMAESELKE
jgi:hypothetical protein